MSAAVAANRPVRTGPRSARAICLLLCLVAAACDTKPAAEQAASSREVADKRRTRVELTFGAFSATREVFDSRLLPAFARQQLRSHGQEILFTKTYAGSEALTESIAAGFAADIAVLAHTRDMESLVRRGLVSTSWRDAPNGGIVCRSIIVLAVRKGNPKAIRDWADLSRPGIAILTADPATSGGGLWNLCAMYGAALRGHAGVTPNDPAAARDFLARVQANVVERSASATESFRSFQRGRGDVVITYESEVALSWLFGHEHERVVPTSTILVESPAALIDQNVDAHGVRAPAQALLQYLWTTEAQKKLASCGLRPVDPTVAAASGSQFPQPKDLWTIEFLGGWRGANEVLAPPPAQPGPGK